MLINVLTAVASTEIAAEKRGKRQRTWSVRPSEVDTVVMLCIIPIGSYISREVHLRLLRRIHTYGVRTLYIWSRLRINIYQTWQSQASWQVTVASRHSGFYSITMSWRTNFQHEMNRKWFSWSYNNFRPCLTLISFHLPTYYYRCVILYLQIPCTP